MKASTKKLVGVAVAALTMVVASCGSSSNKSADTTVAEAQGPKVVASTSWVAAFAKLAGATDITVIAPSNLQHPPDYDPKASDLEAVAEADFILLAGYEGFADRLKEAAGSSAMVETVATEYYPDALEAEVLRIATAMGLDTAVAQSNIDAYKSTWMSESERVKSAIGAAKPVIVSHAFTGVWAALAGLEPVGRGASMGALGTVAPNGEFELGLTIRTFAVANGRIHFWVGGGIVWDSQPAAEIEESWVKARPVLGALERAA